MAITQVQVNAPQHSQKQEKPKRTPMEQILEGLQIANGVLGIGSNVQSIRDHQSNIEANDQKLADTKAGVLTKDQELNARKSFDPAAEGEAGSFLLGKVRTDGKESPLFGKVRQEAAPAIRPPDPTAQGRLDLEKEKFAWEQKQAGLKQTAAATGPGGAPISTYDQKLSKLNTQERQRFDSASMGLNAVDNMSEALGSGDNTFSVVGDNKFTMARRNFEEALGRMQSGGAISSDEANRFASMAPTWRDSEEVQAKKLQDLNTELSLRVKNLGFDPDEVRAVRSQVAGSAKAAPDSGTALAAPSDKAPAVPLDAVEAEMRRRGLKPKGASGSY